MLLLNAKSDVMKSAKDYITSSRIVLGALCAILILMGLVNYVNVTMTGLTMRRREFAVMESIGQTRRQLRKNIAHGRPLLQSYRNSGDYDCGERRPVRPPMDYETENYLFCVQLSVDRAGSLHRRLVFDLYLRAASDV